MFTYIGYHTTTYSRNGESYLSGGVYLDETQKLYDAVINNIDRDFTQQIVKHYKSLKELNEALDLSVSLDDVVISQ